MSWPGRFVQDQRQKTDRAIHRACVRLASDPQALAIFQKILLSTRRRAPRLFEAPVRDGCHPGVDALFHLARFRREHIRYIDRWRGTTASWRPAVASLAHHLICEFRVPTFMASVWHSGEPDGDRKRAWVIAHSRGTSFRSLDLPIRMTRRMERIFLASQDHLQLESALRRAELLALGLPRDIIKAVLSTRLATDLRNAEFWRTFWFFLGAHREDINPAQIGPMIDFIESIRHEHVRIETENGVVESAPPQPQFCMKGRSVASVLRLMREWHCGLADGSSQVNLTWVRSPFEPWVLQEPTLDESETPRRWHLVELTDSVQLRQEGRALHHCVASYAHHCFRGRSSIWSLRICRGERIRPVLTIEVDRSRQAIIQARGRANRPPSGKALQILRRWAVREGLQFGV